jgi:hypothetical protein
MVVSAWIGLHGAYFAYYIVAKMICETSKQRLTHNNLTSFVLLPVLTTSSNLHKFVISAHIVCYRNSKMYQVLVLKVLYGDLRCVSLVDSNMCL